MARSKSKGLSYVAFGLEFIGGVLFLIAAGVFIGPAYPASIGGWNATTATLWLPVIYPAAILASLALFLLSFGNLVDGWEAKVSWAINRLAWVAAASLIVLTAGSTAIWLPILAFILSFMGVVLTTKG